MISPNIRNGILIIVLSVLLAITTLTANVSAETIVRISPEVVRVNESEDFSLEVFIEPDATVSGAEFTLVYDPSLLKVAHVSEGTFLNQGKEQTMFSAGTVDNSNGTLGGVYGFLLGKEMRLEAGAFANIEFTVTGKEGIASIELRDVTVTNSTGTKLPAAINDGRVLVGDVQDIVSSSDADTDKTKKAGHRQFTLGIFALAGMFLAVTKKL